MSSLPGSTSAPDLAEGRPVRALVDTNVILDWLLNRTPWSDEARPMWHAQSTGFLIAYVPASAVTDIFYIARRVKDRAAALPALIVCWQRWRYLRLMSPCYV